MSFRPCAVVPSRNHCDAVGGVLEALRAARLSVFLVDDASDEPARSSLAARHSPQQGVTVVRLPMRAGKGGAVMRGMELASAAGFTHVVQVDADGQHDLSGLAHLLALAEKRPEAVIAGAATYDGTAPLARRLGRWITHVWVWLETLSFSIADSMCGLRIYPLAAVMPMLREERIARFMDFDIDIIVRLSWRGAPVLSVPVRVSYPPGNSSNFEMLRDNLRISRTHARLAATMLLRLPRILAARPRSPAGSHWAALTERGVGWGVAFLAACYMLLGAAACRAVMAPIVAYFYATDGGRRRASRAFLSRAFAARGEMRRPTAWDGFRHHLDFAEKALETFAAWVGETRPDRVELAPGAAAELDRALGRGALLIVSHLGNADLSRALLAGDQRARLTVLTHTRHAERYNAIIRRAQPDAAVNLLQVTEIGPDTAIMLRERIARGEWVAIAGDRTPVSQGGRVTRAAFLGGEAEFSQGPYVLGHLLRCPVYLLFCLREEGRHRLYFERFADRIELPREGREEAIRALAARYAERLASFAERAPYQWYNFFDFWGRERGVA